jgi:hypothetical protein
MLVFDEGMGNIFLRIWSGHRWVYGVWEKERMEIDQGVCLSSLAIY